MNYNSELPASGFLTTQFWKNRYKISNSTLYAWIATGHICAPIRLGKRAVRFRAEDIHRFEEAMLARDVKPAE